MNIARTVLVLLFAGLPMTGNAALAEDVKATLFGEAKSALVAANDAKASVLAPISYAAGAEEYQNAEETLEAGGSIESIKRSLTKAKASFEKATKATELTRAALDAAIQARNDALSAEAEKYASESWVEAERTFATAARRLEEGNSRTAQRIGAEAEEQFRTAELEAIKTNYLSETSVLLEEADDARAKRYAPETFARAQELFSTAETELNENRYDTDRPRSLAQQAKYEAQHAIFLAGLGKQVKDRDLSLEEVVLTWERAIRSIGDQLDEPTYFAEGADPAAAQLRAEIATLQNRTVDLDNSVLSQSQQITVLNQQVADMEEQLGGEQTTLARMNELVGKQDRLRSRLDQVESLFSEGEATVLRKGDDVIIRMVGLNFDSGEAVIKTEHYSLLGTLRQAFDLFPASRIVIEGHTDSYGSDQLNIELSERRAKAVQEYLYAVSEQNIREITSIGYGETKPVANNETAEGRTRNRRIDVVIFDAGTLEPSSANDAAQ